MHAEILARKLRMYNHLEDLSVGGRITLECIL
jgi:hypothetical protein